MFNAIQAKEILVKTTSWIGAFREIVNVVAEKGISVVAISSNTHELTGVVRLITDNNLRAADTLRKHGFTVRERPVIQMTVPHKPGLLRQIALRLEEANIDVKELYATALPESDRCLVILDTMNNGRALVELNRRAETGQTSRAIPLARSAK